MKLTEQQLANFYKLNHQQQSSDEVNAGDCLAAAPASSERLNQAERILNDHTSAQAMRAAMATKQWSHAVADGIEHKQQPWIQKLFSGTAARWALASVSFAFVFMLASPGLNEHKPLLDVAPPGINQNAVNDVINKGYFEAVKPDRLNKGGFDKPSNQQSDVLSSHSFG